HRGAEPQRRGPRADPREEVQRRRDLAEAGEVVLDEERAVIAERLRLDVVLDEVLEARRAVDVGAASPRLRAAEQSESHAVTRPRSPAGAGSHRARARSG